MEQDQLSNFINRDLRGSINYLTVIQGTAKDSGNLYYALEITLVNGYKTRLFLRGGDKFAWCNAFDMIETTNQIDNDF